MAVSASIQTHVDALAVATGYPADAVSACVARPEEAAPLLRALVQRAARGTKLSEAEARQLFLGLHILAKLRDTATFLPLMRLLRRPAEEVEDYLGDAATITLNQILASVFDGDADALFDFISDATSDDALRDAAWHAAAFLTHQGAIPVETLRALIVRFDDERLAPAHDMAWYGWLDTIILLGFEDFVPRALPIWRDGRLDPDIISLAEFKVDLAAAVRAPHDRARFDRAGCGTIDDIAEALKWIQWDTSAGDGDDPAAGPRDDFDYGQLPQPAINPHRNVGRNDPCPCGSGKKAKKCCLANG